MPSTTMFAGVASFLNMTFVFLRCMLRPNRLAVGVYVSQHLLQLLRCVCHHDDIISEFEMGKTLSIDIDATLLPVDLIEDWVLETGCEQSR